VSDTDARHRIDRIERLIHEEVGRNIFSLCEAARGGLFAAAAALASAPALRLGMITGFYVPRGTPPAAETVSSLVVRSPSAGITNGTCTLALVLGASGGEVQG